jgi:hypothetical protein
MSRVFRKTPLGIATFTKQATTLTQSQRALLIMIDGKRNASQLRRFGASFGNVNSILAELYNAGYIELDPAYIERMTKAQEDIAKEAAELPSALVAETVVAGAAMPAAVAAVNPAARVNAKRDLRELASLGEPDPVPTIARGPSTLTLSLAPIDAADNGTPITSARDESINAARQFATRYVFDQIGNSGTALCFALEKALSLQRLQEVADVAAKTLSDMKGAATAESFRKQFRETLRGVV